MNPVTAYRKMLEGQEEFLLATGWRRDLANEKYPWRWEGQSIALNYSFNGALSYAREMFEEAAFEYTPGVG